MSTFGGIMTGFPDIRVDYFRPVLGYPNPLACFLSHVHSDHLEGLETLRSPFIYCSEATKEILLRLERYPHRMNFASGILEARKQHYKALKKLLKPIPLETPTTIELAPGREVQVTLFDANHCTGAVMFLFESQQKAVLYTGDVRSEPWFVDSISRHPCLIEYTSGLKALDCIYLDTSFTAPIKFPTKREGLAELLRKVSKYPPDTIFHFSAWTFGYEEVWLALSKFFQSPIHVDKYKFKIYEALSPQDGNAPSLSAAKCAAPEAPALAGYSVGNSRYPGILTIDEGVRLHSCEKGTKCTHRESGNVVWIKPIITRTSSGQEIGEIGIGGGGGDLIQQPQIELEPAVTEQLLQMFVKLHPESYDEMRKALNVGHRSNIPLSLDTSGELTDIELDELGEMLDKALHRRQQVESNANDLYTKELGRVITFPYSRHSSYEELCHLVAAFKPRDIWPCTVDESIWQEAMSMEYLFGKYCAPEAVFDHDSQMRVLHTERYVTPCNESRRYTSPTLPADVDDGNGSTSGAQNPSVGHRTLLINHAEQSQQTVEVGDILPRSASTDYFFGNTTESAGEGVGSQLAEEFSLTEEPNDTITAHHATLAEVPGLGQIPDASINRRRSASQDSKEVSDRRKRLRLERSSCVDVGTIDSVMFPIGHVGHLISELTFLDATFWDDEDHVFRCNACGWEFDRLQGCCTSSECNVWVKPSDDSAEIDTDNVEIEGCLDAVEGELSNLNDSSDEETDDDSECQRALRADSFIDDATIFSESSEKDDDSPNEGEEDELDGTNYKEIYTALKAQNDALRISYAALEQDFREMRHNFDIFSSDEEDNAIESHSDSDLPYALIDVETKDPPLAELNFLLKDDSQASIVTSSRLSNREAAFDPTLDLENGWDKSLMSVNDNHTKAEVEL